MSVCTLNSTLRAINLYPRVVAADGLVCPDPQKHGSPPPLQKQNWPTMTQPDTPGVCVCVCLCPIMHIKRCTHISVTMSTDKTSTAPSPGYQPTNNVIITKGQALIITLLSTGTLIKAIAKKSRINGRHHSDTSVI